MSKENPNKQSKKNRSIISMPSEYSNLKASVREKLLHLLSDFNNYNPDSIDVLTEYVIVLVTNGKGQSEVKVDLEPFLGDSATDFVPWLWEILSETSNPNANSSFSDPGNISGASSTEADHDASGKHRRLRNCGSDSPASGSQSPVLSNTLAIEETSEDASGRFCKSNKKFREFEDNQDGSSNHFSFEKKPSADILVADVQYEKVHERNPPFKHYQESNVGGRRLFAKAAGAIFLQKGIEGTTRGNVWDRLGKLTETDTSVKVKSNEGDNIKKQTAEQNSTRLGQITWMPTVQDSKVNQNLSWNSNLITCRSNGGQKRQFNDFIPTSDSSSDFLGHEEENSRKYSEQPEEYTYMRTGDVASRKSEKSKSYNKCCTSGFDASVSYRPEKIYKKKLSVDASESTESTQTLHSHGALPSATGRIRPVQAELVDMKMRLQQLETQISKLQSKPANKDGNHGLSFSSGSVDLRMEGVESRTVFVTNVNATATQDALRSYFAKCGAITRVIKLTKPVTVNQKWSAYISFASKESVDKALALNKTNFFSRIIWVRKSGKIAAKSSRSQYAGRRSALFQQNRHRKFHRPQERNHGNDAHGHNSMETSIDGNAELSA